MTGVMVVWVAVAVGRRNREIYVTLTVTHFAEGSDACRCYGIHLHDEWDILNLELVPFQPKCKVLNYSVFSCIFIYKKSYLPASIN